MSILEFVGCSLALVGGLWLGAIYLGIDVRHATYDALSESKLMEKVPEDWRPEGMAPEEAPTSAELAASVQNELVSLRQEITTLRDTHKCAGGRAAAADENTVDSTADADELARAGDARLLDEDQRRRSQPGHVTSRGRDGGDRGQRDEGRRAQGADQPLLGERDSRAADGERRSGGGETGPGTGRLV